MWAWDSGSEKSKRRWQLALFGLGSRDHSLPPRLHGTFGYFGVLLKNLLPEVLQIIPFKCVSLQCVSHHLAVPTVSLNPPPVTHTTRPSICASPILWVWKPVSFPSGLSSSHLHSISLLSLTLKEPWPHQPSLKIYLSFLGRITQIWPNSFQTALSMTYPQLKQSWLF